MSNQYELFGATPAVPGLVLVKDAIGEAEESEISDLIDAAPLGSGATLRLRRRIADGFERRNVELPRRSLYLLSGEVRDEWEHSIAPLDTTRRSVTLRTMRAT